MTVVFSNVCKNFSDKNILKDINCKILDNVITVILGCSGSGKTTMAKIINGLIYPDNGFVFIDDIKISPKNIKLIRSKVGFVLQSCGLFGNMNVIENIMYAPIHVMNMGVTEAENKANFLLERFNLIDYKKSCVKNLSGGQKQRVAIIRSIIMNIKLLIMDEPTANLDPIMKKKFIQIIFELRKNGIGIVMVTHDIFLAKKLAENIIFIANGRVLANVAAFDFFNLNFSHSEKVAAFLQSDKF